MPMPENNLKIQENSLAAGNTDKNKRVEIQHLMKVRANGETKNPTAHYVSLVKIISRNTWADKWKNNMWCSCS